MIQKYTENEWGTVINLITDWFCNRTNHQFDNFIKQTVKEQLNTIDEEYKDEDTISHGLIPNIRMAVNYHIDELEFDGTPSNVESIWGTDNDYAILNNSVVKSAGYKMRVK